MVGVAAGILEGAMLYFLPRFSGLLQPDVQYVVLFLAPLVDGIFGGLAGLVLGIMAVVGLAAAGTGPTSKRRSSIMIAVVAAGLGFAGSYVAWNLDWFRVGAGTIFPARPGILTWVESFAAVSIASLLVLSFRARRGTSFFRFENAWPRLRWRIAALIAMCAFAGAVGFYRFHPPYPYVDRLSGSMVDGQNSGARPERNAAKFENRKLLSSTARRPNIILIVLDTVRADHLSCYGYSRPTTPNLDRLARHGALFESVLSASSWTLASIASIFTGLVPHQNGSDWQAPIDPGPVTLAEILRSHGYATAGFNANSFYGMAGWRLNEGFDVYIDDSYSVRHNLDATWIGQSVLRSAYERLIRYNQFDHRTAADLNRDVMRWHASLRTRQARGKKRPYFLFINYMDAHRPYLPPSPYDRRFGTIPHVLLPSLEAPLKAGYPAKPYTARDRQAMIDGYDNSLSYLDNEIGDLFHSLKVTDAGRPGSMRNTVIIVTSDHGEGFGEHGTYDHGWNLYQDVLRVPLIMEGGGIPARLKVPELVSNRQLFATVLNFALGNEGPLAESSLARFFNAATARYAANHSPPESRFETGSSARARTPVSRRSPLLVVSELAARNGRGPLETSLSLTTSHWQYILRSNGRAELYDLQKDPREASEAGGEPGAAAVAARLKAELEARIGYSVLPWHAPQYLSPFDRPGESFAQRFFGQKESRPTQDKQPLPLGTAQAYFSAREPSKLSRPSPAERNLLRSLPYH